MHVNKTEKGFELASEPMRVEGEAAEKLAAELDAKPSEESQRFQAEARGVYERTQGKLEGAVRLLG